jgi:hypothetical protein
MKYLELSFMQDFLDVVNASGVSVKPEHTAQHSHQGVLDEIKFLKSKQGFVWLGGNNAGGAFLKRKDRQIELISQDVVKVPEHVAYAVRHFMDFEILQTAFGCAGKKKFTLLREHTVNMDALKAEIYQHENGAHIQIVCRKEQIFPIDFE